MDDGEFLDFCYKEYTRSLATAEDMYKRYPFVLTATVLLAGLDWSIARDGLWKDFCVRVDVTAFYLSLIAAFVLVAIGVVYLTLCVVPKIYEEIGPVSEFAAWRDGYRTELAETFSQEEIEAAVALQTRIALSKRMCEAVALNSATAKRRLRWFNRCVYSLSLATVVSGVAVIASWVCRLHGI